jgi:hypothetical protein
MNDFRFAIRQLVKSLGVDEGEVTSDQREPE